MATKIATKKVHTKGVLFTFVDGETRDVLLSDLPKELIERAALHGLSQKCGDSYSGIQSLSEAKEQFKAVYDALKVGEWNRKGGGVGGLWVDALAKATGKDVEAAQAAWDKASEEKRKALKKHPDVVAAHAKLVAAKKAKAAKASTGDADSLNELFD